MNVAPTPKDHSDEWISSFNAVAKLREAGIDDKMTLAHWAEDRLLRTRTAFTRCDGEEHDFDCAPEIPADYWHWVRSDPNAYVNWDAGKFAATIIYEPAKGIHSEREYWQVSYVTFRSKDLHQLLSMDPISRPLPQAAAPSDQMKNMRGAGRPPKAKAWEKFAAAMAVLVKNEKIEFNTLSDNQVHEKIASFMAQRGHDDALTVDTVRGLFNRYKTWADSKSYTDDAE